MSGEASHREDAARSVEVVPEGLRWEMALLVGGGVGAARRHGLAGGGAPTPSAAF